MRHSASIVNKMQLTRRFVPGDVFNSIASSYELIAKIWWHNFALGGNNDNDDNKDTDDNNDKNNHNNISNYDDNNLSHSRQFQWYR